MRLGPIGGDQIYEPGCYAAAPMKAIRVMGILAALLFLTGCGKMGDPLAERTAKEVGTNQVIAYATTVSSATTNILLEVTEIWKGSEEARRLGITNGVQFSEDNPAGSLPEGAILLFSFNTNDQKSSEEIIWVRSRRVGRVTVQDFKAKIGL